jgi:hypothetical protein
MKITGIIIIILAVVIVAAGGYFVYATYFTQNQQEAEVSTPTPTPVVQTAITVNNGPKDTYMEYLNKIAKTGTIEDAMNITMNYVQFATPADKEKAIADATAQLKIMTESEKADQLGLMKDMFAADLNANYVETITGDTAVLSGSNSEGWKTTIHMIKVGGEWKMTQS